MAKFYATAVPRSVLATATDLSGRDGEAAPPEFIAEPAADTVPYGAGDDQVSTEIDGSAYLAAKTAAMRAHATQITVHEPFFALSNWVGQRILAREYYTLLAGPAGPVRPGRPGDRPLRRTGLASSGWCGHSGWCGWCGPRAEPPHSTGLESLSRPFPRNVRTKRTKLPPGHSFCGKCGARS